MGEEVWETSVEQRVRDDGYASKLKHFCICDFERLVTRQTHSPIKNFAKWTQSRHGGIEVPQRVFRDPFAFVALRYVILKLLRVNLFL